jgi:hypothetical protein
MKFWWIKAKTYLIFSIPLCMPSWFFFHNFADTTAMPLSVIGTAIVLHFLITEDNHQAHLGQKNLIMRRRHFSG